jgi:hypothetical protein
VEPAAAAAAADVPPVHAFKTVPQYGSNPSWQFGDFFKLDHAGQQAIKLGLAMHLGVRYGAANPTKPFAETVDGISPYDRDIVETKMNQAINESGKSGATMSTVVNICQVCSSLASLIVVVPCASCDLLIAFRWKLSPFVV